MPSFLYEILILFFIFLTIFLVIYLPFIDKINDMFKKYILQTIDTNASINLPIQIVRAV